MIISTSSLRVIAALALGMSTQAPSLLAQRGGGPGGPGGPGNAAEVALVDRFDANDDGWLDREERDAARGFLSESGAANSGRRGGRGGRGGPGGAEGATTGSPGPRLDAGDVMQYSDEPVYAPDVLRTFFVEFEGDDWEAELEAFYNTDVEVPATVTVDGVAYQDVGIHFRGASSFFTVPSGLKRSLNLSFDYIHDDQNVGGYRTFNLLNAHTDASRLRTVLYLQIAREYIAAPRANFVRVVINGESWGIYPSAQQFNKDFVRDNYATTDGARWKVPGSPNGRGGLEYLGDDASAYKGLYEIKSKDTDESWAALIELTRVLNETPADSLEAALAPHLDIDETLRFLALENVFVNADGYWTRASDYSLYRDMDGRFHVIPHDANETIRAGGGRGGPGGGGRRGGGAGRRGGGPGGPGGPGGGGVTLDPLIGLDDASKPLRSKLLAVPALRERYLSYVRVIAQTWLDWDRLGPVAERYHALIAPDVAMETRSLDDVAAFETSLDELRQFAEARRTALLER